MDDRGFDPNPVPAAGQEPKTSPAGVLGIFLGPDGLRAGWRLLIFLVLAVIVGFGLVVGASPLVRKFNPPGVLVFEGVIFLSALVAALVMGRIEKRSLADYGLPRRGAFGGQFWRGIVWGFLALTILLLLIRLDHGFDFGSLALSGSKAAYYAVYWGFTFLVVGFAEEFVFRGYALATLSSGMGFWAAAFVLSAIFGLVHLNNGGENWKGALAAGLIGLFFCLTLWRTGSLWFAIGFHAGWDYAESFIFSVPDSGAMVPGHLLNSSFHGPQWLTGGSVGPEGSLLVFVIVAGLFLVFNHFYREIRFPPPAGS